MARYITVNETEKCVMARITRNKELHQANFTLKRYKTYERAEAAAKRWVKATLPELPEPVTVRGMKTARNTSGVVGVRLANATRVRNGNVYPDWRWVAFWPGCPFSGGVGWSVNKYGDDIAFVSAYLARQWELADRGQIEAELSKPKNSRQIKRVLKLKQLAPP